eukprot:4278-Pelagomonas_calceolata.AAC.9
MQICPQAATTTLESNNLSPFQSALRQSYRSSLHFYNLTVYYCIQTLQSQQDGLHHDEDEPEHEAEQGHGSCQQAPPEREGQHCSCGQALQV